MSKLFRFCSRYPRRLAALALLATVFALFVVGAQPFAVNLIPSPWDKFAHVAVFTAIAFAVGLASGLRGRLMLLLAVGGAALIGVFDEWHQLSLPGRDAGWDDLTADLVGGLLGAVMLARARRWFDPAWRRSRSHVSPR